MSENKKKKSFLNGVFAGLGSGIISAVTTQPFEVIKTALLVNPNKNQTIDKENMFKAFIEATKQVYKYKNRGLRNFIMGSQVSVIRQCIGFASYSYLIETFNDLLSNFQQLPKTLIYMISAPMAKMIVMTVTVPLSILKTRFELIYYQRQNFVQEIKKLTSTQGAKGIIRGLDTLVIREVTFSLVQYSTYRYLRQILIEQNQQKGGQDGKINQQKKQQKSQKYYLNFIPGYLSGLLGVIFSQPFEVVRNRIMVQNIYLQEKHQYQGMFHGIRQILQTDGFDGLFRGVIPSLAQKPIRICITWGLFETIKEIRSKNKPSSNQ